MKKLFMAIVCLMVMVMNINGQNLTAIKQAAVNALKKTLTAPSTFILTDGYGNKIPINKVKAKLINKETEIDTIYFRKGESSLLKNSQYDSIVPFKKVYYAVYEITFNFETQNSYGGMEADFCRSYVTKDGIATNEIPYRLIGVTKKDYQYAVENYGREIAKIQAEIAAMIAKERAKKIEKERKTTNIFKILK